MAWAAARLGTARSGWSSCENWSVKLEKGGVETNVVNQSNREGVFAKEVYPMIHRRCLQLAAIKGVACLKESGHGVWLGLHCRYTWEFLVSQLFLRKSRFDLMFGCVTVPH